MRFLSKLVWSEGMYLCPQHFQAQNRYFEDSVHFAVESLCFAPNGLIASDFDAEAIRNGVVSLREARGIFPDGLCFDIKGSGAVPPFGDSGPISRTVRELFPPTRDRMVVYLAVPEHKASGPNCSLTDGETATARYTATEVNLMDEVAGRDQHPVRLASKNMRLLFDVESSDGFQTIPIARILHDGAGALAYDSKFVPPCICIRASESLRQMLNTLIEIIEEKAVAVAPGSKSTGFRAGMSSGDVAAFWFLHTLRSNLPALRHLSQNQRSHPEELFRVMSQLAGALCTFGVDSHPRSLPAYDHERLEDCFAQIDTHIRTHLDFVVPSQTISITLSKREPGFYEGSVDDQRALGRSRWVLGLHSAAGDADMMRKAPDLLKVCSGAFVSKLVERALPGLTLTHLPVPPSAISAKVDAQYFSVSRSGPCWEHIMMTKKVGIYVPNDFPAPEIELLVILET